MSDDTLTRPLKTCTKCCVALPLSEFSVQSSTKDGLRYICKPCGSKVRKEYSESNRCKTRMSDKAYRQRRRDQIKCYQKENQEAIRARAKEYRAENVGKIRARTNAMQVDMSDLYIANLMGMKISECPKDLIEIKREHLKTYRLMQDLTTAINEVTQGEKK